MDDPRIIDIEPRAGAGLEIVTPWSDLRANIRNLFDRLYAPGALAPGHGHNFIVYANSRPDRVAITVGVLDRQPGGADPDVRSITVPAGTVITAPHWGDYAKMRSTYERIEAELATKGLRTLDLSFELYGDWSDDPAKARTDIHIYLKVKF